MTPIFGATLSAAALLIGMTAVPKPRGHLHAI